MRMSGKGKEMTLRAFTVSKKSVFASVYENRYFYIMLMPGLLFFAVFSYVPMYGIQLAFKDFMINKGISGSPLVGFEHFRALFREASFLTAFKNTLIISLLKVVFGFPFGVGLALLINELRFLKAKRFLQTVYTFPHFLSWVIISGIAFNFLGTGGAVNNLVSLFGGQRIEFLIDKALFRYLLVFTEIWKESGWATIIYLAAIAGIDPSLYEAAVVDGAGRYQRMRFITLPGIMPTIVALLILQFGNVMQANFEQVFNMYNPAVYSVSDIIDTYVYRLTFQTSGDFGFGTAVGMFKSVVNMVMLLAANGTAKRLGHSGII